MTVITLLPLGLKGNVYRSVMPFSYYDSLNLVFQSYKEKEISVVVLLSSVEECCLRAGRDLRQYYKNEGMKVIYLPVNDFGALTFEILSLAVETALADVQGGSNLVIHCFAGCGRTGMFAACLAGRVLGLTGPAAIDWVRSHVPCAVEATSQAEAVNEYCARTAKER